MRHIFVNIAIRARSSVVEHSSDKGKVAGAIPAARTFLDRTATATITIFMLHAQEQRKVSFFRKRLSLDIRPYGRKEYSKALSTIWISCLLLGVVLAFIEGILGASRFIRIADLITALGSVAIYIFFVYFLYQVTVLRSEELGDNRKIAWLTLVPFVNFVFPHIYLIRPDKSEPTTDSLPFTKGEPTKGRIFRVSFYVFIALGVLMSFYFVEESGSMVQGIAMGVLSGFLVGGTTMFMLMSSRGKK